MTKSTVLYAAVLAAVILFGPALRAQTPQELFNRGKDMTQEAVQNDDFYGFLQGVQLMEKAAAKDKQNADWCYEIGQCYSALVPFGGHFFAVDPKKGLKWHEKGARLGNLYSALFLFEEYTPESSPGSIFAPDKEWKKYFKERDKAWEYISLALQAGVPEGFNRYLSLAKAASFVHNDELANLYAAKAADNDEYGAIDYLIKDERALVHLASPEAMYKAALALWKRGSEEFGHRDRDTGFSLMKKSADLDFAPAQEKMAANYLKGIGTRPDTVQAVKWYKIAAKNGSLEGKRGLGVMYLTGLGVDKDPEEGMRLLRECEAGGNRLALLDLGYCHHYGMGTAPDREMARKYFLDFFNGCGHAPGAVVAWVDNRLIDLNYLLGITYYEEGSPEAIPLFESKFGSKDYNRGQISDIFRKMAECFRTGRCGVEIDLQKADEYLKGADWYGTSEIDETNVARYMM